ncbi:MAG: efflux RND transporter permease subunit [Bacteroidales bacterium]|nr:efflux RND transporter permease subunit [Bacteroidales bacterium]MCF8352004.1 efflux RND transporter permease subunit [Bacteroidales bacterium]MCF8376575.1 efflux RND transporter permease subunit [Bacteroidales bacterium]
MNIIRSSLKHPQIQLVTILLIFLVGIYSLLSMPRRSSPEITIRQALVVAFYPGATAQQVQEQVTKQIEQQLFTFSEVKKDETYSTTKDGLVYVTVTLQDWVELPDLFWDRLGQNMLLLAETKLPDGVIGPVVNANFGDVVALLIGVETKTHSYSELNNYLDIIENQLRRIPAVSKIERLGYQAEEIEISVNSEKLARFGVDLMDVIRMLESQNTIKYSGFVKSEYAKINLYTTGLYSTKDQIAEQIIGMSEEGAIARVKDIGEVKRKLSDPTQTIRVNGNKSNFMLISLQMQPGYNIVQFGEEVDEALAQAKNLLPDEISFHTINNQPEVVKSAVNDFMREFIIAVLAVILVIMLLLPFNIALIAAISIPVSIGMTFAFLNLFGYELQQVSLASLIVVLGMVVDNAVVVIDNYVEKLDEGMKRFEAAWRSATEFSVPLFSSTLSIIMAFLPLVFMLSGSTGEFLISLPVTVAIAMSCSLLVAYFLTPFLAFLFIRKGLKKKDEKKKGFSFLNIIQNLFDHAIGWAMKRKAATIAIAIIAIVAGVFMMKLLKQQFFPNAERNQFVIQVFEPLGTKYDVTERDVSKIEEFLKKDSNITVFASFIGTSAPRVYYSFAPVFPQESYAQFLVNTSSADATEAIAPKYEKLLDTLLPNAQVDVMQFAQGVPVSSPVEVRVYGDNISELQALGDEIASILRKAEGSRLIRTDFEDNYFLKLEVEDQIANQLGFTTEVIADLLAAGFHGAPFSTLWEGDDPLKIVFRLEEQLRKDFENIRNTYISSPITGKSIPLRQIAEIQPEWQTGKITRRNGIPAITVGCKPQQGYLASGIQDAIQPEVDKISLPAGYTLEYGGDIKNQKETFGHMIVALIISLVAIYLILLFEFRDMLRPLIIMVSIPLTLFGSILGLVVTGNVFSFTAFVGLIALVGIVIRNALIIVDYADGLANTENISRHQAALESGKRRLRPIFLTTMAAAIGVVPMIVLKDPLWAPLASVFAFGIVFSMVLTLMVIPALYGLLIKNKKLQEEQA